MGMLDGLLGSLMGRMTGDGTGGKQSPLVQIALQLMQQNGGLQGLLAKFQLTGDTVYQNVLTLSGGEKTKLALAKLVAGKHNVYFMWRPYLRDAKDDMVLEAAVTAEATYIVTFNTKDFQGVGRFGVQALWPADFLLQIGAL